MEGRPREALVGRARELWELERALAAAQAGNGAAVLIAGDAGIGKTRLVSELATRAGAAGFEVLLGRSIDLVGSELPYLPFVDALGPLDAVQADGRRAGSQLRMFEETLELLTVRAAAAPVLLVLEDLHWADASTLDLLAFLAHSVDDRPILLLATFRRDEPASSDRMRRLADVVLRAEAATVVELGPLERGELADLLAARSDGALAAVPREAILERSEGNPFFAEELLAASGGTGDELPRRLRDLLLQRVVNLDRSTLAVVRLAAAAGREVEYPLLRAASELPEPELRESLRRAVEQGVLVSEQATRSFRFRHALLAEAVYTTLLPGEREDLHARLAEELACRDPARPAELAPHWAAAGRTREALAASFEAAREAGAVFGLAEAHAHMERALALWSRVPDAAELLHVDLAELCSQTAELASQTGAAPRAVELARRAIELVEESGDDPLRAARLHESLGRYLHESGRTEAALSAFERMVELVPAQPPSPERAHALAALATGLMMNWRFDESLEISRQALALARAVGARSAELRAILDLGRDLAYLGRADEGLARVRRALELAEESGDALAVLQAYVCLTDMLTMLGRPREAARRGKEGLASLHRYGIDSTVLVANYVEALLAIGDWDEAESASSAALRAMTANYPYMPLMLRAHLEIGRGRFEEARAHLDAALTTLREDRGQGIYDVFLAELAISDRRWTEADEAVRKALAQASSRQASQLRVWFAAKGLRAGAELAALARARRDADAARGWLVRSDELIAVARGAADEASGVTPNTDGWLRLAEAEYQRARGVAQPRLWSEAADTWNRLQQPPLAAYCRWREAEALVALGASRTDAGRPLREAHAVAARIGAQPMLREVGLLAERARLDLATPPEDVVDETRHDLTTGLGLTAREAEVLALVARGYTNREIADTLVISVKTASVHVSHILRKLDAPNRSEAAAIAHRLAPPGGT